MRYISLQGTKETPRLYQTFFPRKGRDGRRNRLKGARGRGTLEKEKPPIFGMIQRCGQVVIQMLPNVRQATIEPLIKATIQPGTLVYTDEYAFALFIIGWMNGVMTMKV